MDAKEITLEYKGFIKLNLGQNGFYRTSYSPSLLAKLKQNMNKFEPIDRYGILYSFLSHNEIDHEFVNLLEAYKGEDSYIVWSLLELSIQRLKEKLIGRQRLNKLKVIINKLFGESFIKVGKFECDSIIDTKCITQGSIARILGLLAENKEVIEEAVKKFKENISNGFINLSSEIREVTCYLACYSGMECIDLLKKADISLWKKKNKILKYKSMMICKELSEEALLELMNETRNDPEIICGPRDNHNFYPSCLKTLERYLIQKDFDKINQSKILDFVSSIPDMWIIEYKDCIDKVKNALPTEIPETCSQLKESILTLHTKSLKVMEEFPELTKAIDDFYDRLTK